MRALGGRSKGVLAVAVLVASASCGHQGTGSLQRVTQGSVTVQIPPGWQRKPGELTFRRQEGGRTVAFIAVDQVPTRGRPAGEVLAALRASALTGQRTVETERTTTWKGMATDDLVWSGRLKDGRSVRGVQRFVTTPGAIVAIFWYVPSSDWDREHTAMEQIADSVEIK